MGGPKRVMLAIVFVLLALVAALSIWFATLKPEVRSYLIYELLGMSRSGMGE